MAVADAALPFHRLTAARSILARLARSRLRRRHLHVPLKHLDPPWVLPCYGRRDARLRRGLPRGRRGAPRHGRRRGLPPVRLPLCHAAAARPRCGPRRRSR